MEATLPVLERAEAIEETVRVLEHALLRGDDLMAVLVLLSAVAAVTSVIAVFAGSA